LFNNLRKQTENEITLIKKKMENMEIDLNSAINQIKMKLSKMDETKIVRAFVEETVKQSEFDIKTYATKAVQDLEDKLSEEARQRFQVDKLIGQKEVYPSFEEF
jgi:glutamate synthase domain-containing protein 2